MDTSLRHARRQIFVVLSFLALVFAAVAPAMAEDCGESAHPSGNDRCVEAGGSGTQGDAQSDPDDDTRGPERTNGGADEPGGPGGVNKLDQDGNNGCGNDQDFEDDNEGWCTGKPAPAGEEPEPEGEEPGNPGGPSEPPLGNEGENPPGKNPPGFTDNNPDDDGDGVTDVEDSGVTDVEDSGVVPGDNATAAGPVPDGETPQLAATGPRTDLLIMALASIALGMVLLRTTAKRPGWLSDDS